MPSSTTDITRNKEAPLKVTVFAWCLLHNRISNMDNFFRREILHDASCLCLGGCGSDEYVDRLFFILFFIGLIKFGF